MNSYKFLTNVMCDGMHYAKDSVHKLNERDALNFGDAIVQVPEVSASVEGAVDAAVEEKVAPAHPNKMLKPKRATKK